MKRKKPKKQTSAAAAARAKRKKKKHVKFLRDHCMLHFARYHPDCGNAEASQCNDYNHKLGTAPGAMGGPGEAAVHHLLPVSAVVRFMKLYKGDPLENIASVYGAMDWCINKKSNLVWLPYFPAYQRHLAQAQPGGAPQGLAAHNFDHNPHYNDLVVARLKPLWEDIAAQKPTDDCQKAQEIVKTLDEQIDDFRKKVTARKTQGVLDKANELNAAGKRVTDLQREPALSSWWKVFSMNPGKAKQRPHALLRFKPPRPKLAAALG